MNKWRTLAHARSIGEATAETALVNAYRDVFGRQTETVELVLADLAVFCAFYQVEPPTSDLSSYQAGYANGLRAAFGRVFHFLNLTDEQWTALELAARFESEQIQG